MCGFAGLASAAPVAGNQRERLAALHAMGRQLRLRGPDDEQLLVDAHIALIFRRLSIVDCAWGRQPIPNEDATLFVAVNGEIYNHKALRSALRGAHHFRTQSDSEVVVHLYEERGPDALTDLIGMFAIAIWDSVQQRLFLARDRLGIKPLYYSQQGSDLLFASEVKALLAHPVCPRQFNWDDWSPRAERFPTFARGVDILPAAHYMTWDVNGDVTTGRYWSLDQAFQTPDAGLSVNHYVDRFADLFEDSVSLRLMADVPLGAFLSGGLDSAAMVAVASKHHAPLPCFTILEKSTLLCGDAQAAEAIASELEAPFYPVLFDHETLASELGLGLEAFEYFIWLMDYPLFTLEFLFKHELHRFAKTAVPDIKVMLIGQGADEFSGGYSHGINTTHTGWDDYVQKTVVPLWQADRRAALGIPDRFASIVAPDAYGPPPVTPFAGEMNCRLRTLQMFNLWHEDRTSSGQGIEARVPYLDHRLVELLASIPQRLHRELFWDKEIIRRAARRWLPESLIRRRKVPFIYTANRASTVDFMYRWIVAAFPAFREKYLQGPHRLFDDQMLATFVRLATKQPERREQAVRLLAECIAISIFSRMCREGPGEWSGTWRPPSPLERRQPAEAPWAVVSTGLPDLR